MNTKITRLSLFGILFTISIFMLSSCGSSNREVSFKKEPLDELIRDYSNVSDFSIILYDMDYNEGRNAYVHQYRVLYAPQGQDTLLEKVTDWKEVSDVFFDKHKENMGMEIASKKNGVVKKIASPPGYSNYVGNEKYGHWKQRSDGTSFWEFYGKYAFMSSMFRMMMYPVGYSYWHDYRTNYYAHGRPYYGQRKEDERGGARTGNYRRYGTGSKYNSENKKSSKWNSRSSNFKNKVRSKVQRSATQTKQRRARANSRTKSRSNSRYRSSSNYRSRGGGFGK